MKRRCRKERRRSAPIPSQSCGGKVMSIAKVIELSSSSRKGIEDAVTGRPEACSQDDQEHQGCLDQRHQGRHRRRRQRSPSGASTCASISCSSRSRQPASRRTSRRFALRQESTHHGIYFHAMVTTALELPGHRIMRNLGVVRGIVVRSRSIVGNIGAALQSLVGGNITLVHGAVRESARRCVRADARSTAPSTVPTRSSACATTPTKLPTASPRCSLTARPSSFEPSA